MSARKVAATLLGTGFAVNVAAGKLGLPTICVWGRDVAHVDKPAGRVVVIAVSTAVYAGWLIHFLDPAKRPVRALARLAELVDDARVEF